MPSDSVGYELGCPCATDVVRLTEVAREYTKVDADVASVDVVVDEWVVV